VCHSRPRPTLLHVILNIYHQFLTSTLYILRHVAVCTTNFYHQSITSTLYTLPHMAVCTTSWHNTRMIYWCQSDIWDCLSDISIVVSQGCDDTYRYIDCSVSRMWRHTSIYRFSVSRMWRHIFIFHIWSVHSGGEYLILPQRYTTRHFRRHDFLYQGSTILVSGVHNSSKNSTSHFQTVGARWLTWNKFCTVDKWPTWSTITLYKTFLIVINLCMFRATLCSSSGGQIVSIQHLVEYSL